MFVVYVCCVIVKSGGLFGAEEALQISGGTWRGTGGGGVVEHRAAGAACACYSRN